MTKTIEIIVAPDGQTKIETKGFAGADCQDASRFIEQALGERTAEMLTPEFYAQRASNTLSAGEGPAH
jgi:hypothetical protein